MKLNKIKVAFVTIGFLAALPVWAVTDNYEAGTDADAKSSYSTAIGVDALSGNGLSWGRTNAVSPATYGPSVFEDDQTTGPGDRTTNSNRGSTAIGNQAEAGTGEEIRYLHSVHGGDIADDIYVDYQLGHGQSTAVGYKAEADWGGTALGATAEATGQDSVAIGKEAVASGHKSVAVGEDTVANGMYSSAIGNGAAASGRNASAFGVDSVAEGEDSTAIGAAAEATGENSVALGAGSIADRDNNVSVGSTGNERTISNVAPGVFGTDAVNLNQLNAVERKVSAGVSAAMAMTTPVISAGKSNGVAVGAASFNGTSAISLNLAHKFTDDVVATASAAKGFNGGRTSRGSNDDIGLRASVSWSF
jgi:autotransporter adhesin